MCGECGACHCYGRGWSDVWYWPESVAMTAWCFVFIPHNKYGQCAPMAASKEPTQYHSVLAVVNSLPLHTPLKITPEYINYNLCFDETVTITIAEINLKVHGCK